MTWLLLVTVTVLVVLVVSLRMRIQAIESEIADIRKAMLSPVITPEQQAAADRKADLMRRGEWE